LPFVHLHVHTVYSANDSTALIPFLVKRAKELRMSALAITDHGNMYGVTEFCLECASHGIKPIIGCEVYVCPNRHIKESVGGKAPKLEHLVLLCKNETGYKNLIRLVSLSNTEGFYYKPRIDFELLKDYTEGLICLSGCLGGAVPQALLHNDIEKATRLALEYKALFGDDYYIEIQDHGMGEQRAVLPHLISIARKNGIKLVATNDTHYLKKEDWATQKVLQCIAMRKQLSPDELDTRADENRSYNSIAHNATDAVSGDDYFLTHEYYLKTYDEMAQLFENCLDALDNTNEIAGKCECYFFNKKPLLPEFAPPKGFTPAEYLRKLTYDGLEKKYPTITTEIKQRADYELSVIENLGFVDYFLIVWDFIFWAQSNGISVGPGRGSGVGSIVAFALDITKPDPLKYSLIFERFLNPDRISNPDFDIDFCVDRREEVIDYVIEKYGEENVCQIITFGSLKTKQAFKDVGRVLQKPYHEMDRYVKLIPGMIPPPLKQLLGFKKDKDGLDKSNPDVVELYNSDPSVKQIFDFAIKVEGFPRQTGMHAAGVIICRDPIYKHIPLSIAVQKNATTANDKENKDTKKSDDAVVTTQFDMVECEELGLLKMDFLGLRTLTDIKNAVDMVYKNSGKKIDFYSLEYNDKAVFDMIGAGDTNGVFQLESEGMTRFMMDLKPNTLEDIIAGVSLYRPGPMDYIPKYVLGKKNPDKVIYDHNSLESILNVTYGVMVYQEQVIQVAQKLAGYTVARADVLRAIIGKKKKDKFPKERTAFIYGEEESCIPGCIKNGIPENVAAKIFADMVQFGNYAFNKSHATAYAYVAYQTAYLKVYHPVEYITAVLNNRIGAIDTTGFYLRYAKQKGITVLPPDINYSNALFSVENGAIRIGLSAIKNVGTAIIEHIERERERGGKFNSFEEFVTRMSFITINKRVFEGFILSGALDCFGINRRTLFQNFDTVVAKAAKDRAVKDSGQFSMFDSPAIASDSTTVFPKTEEYNLWDKFRFEKEVSGIYISGHPLEGYAEFLNSFKINSSHFAGFSENGDSESSDSGDNSQTLQSDMRVTLGGMLVEATKRFTKNGKELGVGRLEDMHGTVEVFLSGHALNKFKDVFVLDKLVTITGSVRFGNNDGDTPTLWIQDIVPLNPKGREVNKKKICFYFDKENAALLSEVQDILLAYPGHDDTFVKGLDDNSKVYSLDIPVQISRGLLLEIEGLLGSNGYKVAE